MRSVDPSGIQGQAASKLAEAAFAVLEPVAAAQSVLADWPTTAVPHDVQPEPLPVLRWLQDAVTRSSPATAHLMAVLAETAGALAWRQSYAAADFGPAFLERYGWTELVGPSGPFASDRIACGFLVLGPEIHYPSHAHEAEELYVPLSGTALWQVADAPPRPVAPGTPIHHPSWIPHAMWTQAEALVALYCWRGGALGAKPQIVSRG